MGSVGSLNVGLPRVIGTQRGAPVMSAIGKEPVAGPLTLHGVNFAGDDQADRTVHGGPDKAVYAYASADLAWWAEELERDVPPGMFGENLTTDGIDCTNAVIGERWQLEGGVELEVCQPRLPCFKLGLHFDDPRMLRRFAQASRPGAYLRIVREGEVAPGAAITVGPRPEHGVTVAEVSDAILKDAALGAHVVRATELPAELADWIRSRG